MCRVRTASGALRGGIPHPSVGGPKPKPPAHLSAGGPFHGCSRNFGVSHTAEGAVTRPLTHEEFALRHCLLSKLPLRSAPAFIKETLSHNSPHHGGRRAAPPWLSETETGRRGSGQKWSMFFCPNRYCSLNNSLISATHDYKNSHKLYTYALKVMLG